MRTVAIYRNAAESLASVDRCGEEKPPEDYSRTQRKEVKAELRKCIACCKSSQKKREQAGETDHEKTTPKTKTTTNRQRKKHRWHCVFPHAEKPAPERSTHYSAAARDGG